MAVAVVVVVVVIVLTVVAVAQYGSGSSCRGGCSSSYNSRPFWQQQQQQHVDYDCWYYSASVNYSCDFYHYCHYRYR